MIAAKQKYFLIISCVMEACLPQQFPQGLVPGHPLVPGPGLPVEHIVSGKRRELERRRDNRRGKTFTRYRIAIVLVKRPQA